ncbi:hypothetical protein M405DRAFT_304114 [Rhizopogon salebrosus TDB-379]|nr:hypothetical protein M405DRAFT_304114 [Rhizopogon salebrosus TDB-379]
MTGKLLCLSTALRRLVSSDIMMSRFIRTPCAMPYTPGKHLTDYQSCSSQVPLPSGSYSSSFGALLSTIPMPAE